MKTTIKKSSAKKSTPAKTSTNKKNSKAATTSAVKGKTTPDSGTRIQRILITNSKPESDKNPYSDLAKKYKVQIDFKPMIHLEGISAVEFRKYKINPLAHGAVVFTSRNAIDHFFKLCEDLRIKMPQDTKYYCMTESIALYLQKYILYRKRKVFYADGTMKNLFQVILKYRDKEKLLIPCADNHNSELPDFLTKQKIDFSAAIILRTVPVKIDPKELLQYDLIAFFTPAAVKSLFYNIPDFKQGNMKIAAFGPLTCNEVVNNNLRLDIKAPVEGVPSMAAAIEKYLQAQK